VPHCNRCLCITPYVGGGVGFASLSITGYQDVNVPNLSVAYGQNNTETNFAWAVYAGLSYKVNPSLTLDLSYRYTASRSRTSPQTTSCFRCAWRWARSPRRCRLPLNRSPSTIRLLAH